MSAKRVATIAVFAVLLLGSAGAMSAWANGVAPSALPKTLTKLCGLPYVNGTVIRFHADDGAQLVGAVTGKGQVGVVLANTSDGEICDWVAGEYKLINSLVAKGYRVLLFDYRGTGRSPKVAGARSGAWDSDAIGAAAELRGLGSSKTVLIGASTGGIVVLAAASRLKPTPAAIIGLSASGDPGPTSTGPAKGGLDGKAAVGTLRVPLLFVVARQDPYGYAPTRLLFRLARTKDKQLLVVPGQAHGFFDSDASRPKVDAEILNFVGSHTHS